MENKDKFIDLSYLHEISNGSKDFINELIGMFNEQVPEYQEILKNLYNQKDWYNLGRTAHKAKSAILMMGMKDLAADLKKLELDAKEGENIDEYQEIIAKFVRVSDIALEELKEIQKKI